MADIKFLITVDATGAVTSVKAFDGELDKLQKGAGKTGQGLEGLWKQFAGGQLVVDGVKKGFGLLTDFMKDSIAKAIESEEANNNLSAALSSTGRTVGPLAEHFKNYADELMNVTVYDGEAIKGAQALLLTMGRLDKEGVDRATRGAIGLASVYKIDLQTAARAVGSAFEGQYASLGKMIPGLSAAKTESEKLAIMNDFLEKSFLRAKAETETFGGSLKQLTNSWNEIKTAAGRAVIENEDFIKTLAFLKSQAKGSGETLGSFKEVVNGLSGVLKFLIPPLRTMEAVMDAEARSAKRAADFNLALKAMIGPLGEAFKGAIPSLSGFGSQLTSLLSLFQMIPKKMNEVGTGLKKLTPEQIAAAAAAAAAFKKLGDEARVLTDKYTPLIDQMRKLKEEEAKLKEARKAGAISAAEYTRGMDGNAKAFREVGVAAGATAKAYGEVQKAGWAVVTQALTPLQTAMVKAIADAKALSKAFGDGKNPAAYAKGLKVIQKELKDADEETKKLARTQKKDLADSFTAVVAAANPMRAAVLAAIAQEKIYDNALKAGFITKKEYIKLIKAMAGELKDKTGITGWVKANQEAILKVTGAFASMASQVDAINQQSLNNKLLALDKEYQAKLLNIQNSLLSETEKNTAITALEAEFEMKRRSLQRSAAEKQKATAIANAIINVIEAVTKAITSLPVPYNFIMAGITAAFGAVQIAKIKAQPIPLAAGAIFRKPVFSPGGDYQAGEAGPEAVIPLKELPRIMRELGGARGGRGSNRPIVNEIRIYIDGREMKSFITKSVMEQGDLGRLRLAGKVSQ